MKKLVLAFASNLLFCSSAFANFLPPNNLHLEDNPHFSQGITEEEFNAVLDKVKNFYEPIIRDHDGYLILVRRWWDSTVDASASQIGASWYVYMYGGLARRAELTIDGFTMVACHEIGHHLGGYPFVSEWAANEGQSDYFALQSCARELWRDEHEENAKSRDLIGEYPKKLCDERFANEQEQNLCYRQLLAAQSLANILRAVEDAPVAYETPDSSVVTETNNTHPKAQCRLDTFLAGTMCKTAFDPHRIPKSQAEAFTASCGSEDAQGARPQCWFAP